MLSFKPPNNPVAMVTKIWVFEYKTVYNPNSVGHVFKILVPCGIFLGSANLVAYCILVSGV